MMVNTQQPSKIQVSSSQGGLTVKAYRGDGAVMLAFDLDPSLTQDLAGFAIQCTPPVGQPFYLPNRLDLTTPVTSQTAPEQLQSTPSNQAPFQKFRWVDFPSEVIPGLYRYDVSAMYFDADGGLKAGPMVEVSLELDPDPFGQLEIGFTRGYLSSQAYAAKFKNAPFEPEPKTIDFDTTPYLPQYEWLGYHARRLVFDFLQECLDDPAITVDCFAYDLDEPDFIRGLIKLGPRLRAFLDDAPLHTKPGALEIPAKAALIASAGAANVKAGHFKRFAHCKVLIQKKNGQAVKVLTGSANFSVRGLYVQANNVLVFDDPFTAQLYEQAFNQAFTDMQGFDKASIAQQWYDVNKPGLPSFSACLSPHKVATVSLGKVSQAIQNASSSVLFAVMELGGGGDVLSDLQSLATRQNIFSYGVTQTDSGMNLYKPGAPNALLVPFAYLTAKVSQPFRAEYSGGMGQVIHDKFVVVDFNGPNPVVFTGSSNLAEGGELENGDNLLAIYDPRVAATYAVEAIRLVDHYHFRAAMQAATDQAPLQLQGKDAPAKWWQPYYDSTKIQNTERLLFSQ